jgi:hypothetical protein
MQAAASRAISRGRFRFAPLTIAVVIKRLLFVVLVIAAAPSLVAWGEAGHYLVNDAATRGLPNDMPPFFYAAFPDLVYLAYDPDRWKGGGESIDAVNEPDHFLNFEDVASIGPLPRNRYKYLALLESSGVLRRTGLANSDPGFLPWRIAELSERLTVLWRRWRSAPTASRDRLYIEHDIVTVAGILGHYVGDAAQPLHATTNYNGWLDPNPNGYTNDCDTHSEFESRFVARVMTVDDVTPHLAAPRVRSDYFAAALEELKASNAQVEPFYRLEKADAFAPYRAVSAAGKRFTAERIAFGASTLRDIWWSAWRNSATPPPRRNAPQPAS